MLTKQEHLKQCQDAMKACGVQIRSEKTTTCVDAMSGKCDRDLCPAHALPVVTFSVPK